MVEDIIDFRMLFEEDGFSGVTTEIEREIFSDGPDDSFFRVMDKNGNTVFSSDLSPWNEADIDPDLLGRITEDSDPPLVTIAAPDNDHDARVVYGWIGPDMIMQTGESMEDIQELLTLLSTIFSVTFAVVVAFASFSGWLLARRALRGVEEVSRAAIDVANGTLERRMLANLLDNAFKYSEPDSRVTVGVNTQDHAVQLSVRDEWIGISQQDLKKIFDRYFRCEEVARNQAANLASAWCVPSPWRMAAVSM